MARTALDAMLGRLLDDGTELELLGGLNFVGFAITEGEGYWTVTNEGGAISDNSVALAKLVNASAQYQLVGRKSASAGAWESCTLAELGITTTGIGAVPTARTLTAGTNMSGGGDLSANRTLSLVAALTGITSVNGATVCAPVEGAVITTTATINVSQGNQRTVTAAGGAYAITLHASTGSPYTGESITLVCATALANAVTVTNGGAGGTNIGFSGGTLPSGFKGAASFYFDGTNWALSVGSVIRFA